MFGTVNNQYSSYQAEVMAVGLSGTQNDMVARPFILHASEGALDQFVNNTNVGTNINHKSVLTDGQPMITLQAEGLGVVDIEGGWGTERNIVTLVLIDVNTRSKYILSGYTSPDFMINGNYNDYANITFNNLTELQAIRKFDGTLEYQLANSDNILSNTEIKGSYNNYTNKQRPIDVLENAAQRNTVGMAMGNDVSMDTPITTVGIDGGNRLAPELSRVGNASGSDYLYRTSKGFMDAQMIGGSTNDLGNTLSEAVASDLVYENSYDSSGIINHILGSVHGRASASVTFGELSQAIPGLNQVIKPITEDSGISAVDSSSWHGRVETVPAGELAAAIPNIMSMCGIQAIGFTMSNDTMNSLDGYSASFGLKASPMTAHMGSSSQPYLAFLTPDIPQEQMLAKFTAYMNNVIFPSTSRGRRLSIDVEASSIKSIVIAISIDGAPYMRFPAGVFSSSKWSPINATSVESNTSMGSGMLALTNHISNVQEGNVSVNNTPMGGMGGGNGGFSHLG